MKKMMMIVAMMAATVTASAQFEAGTFSLQPKLGATGSMLSNMPNLDTAGAGGVYLTSDKTATGGFIIGGEAEYQLTNVFSLAAGVNYAQQGSGWKDKSFSVNGVVADLKDAKVELGYVNVPIVANVYLFKGFALKAGVQFGFLTNADMKFTLKSEQGNLNQSSDFDQSIMDGCEKFDIAIPVGVSYQFKVPIVIDARYNIGLKNVSKEVGEDFKNQVFQITVGYKFAL
jgi:hypothetical protein